ncbi:MAG: hypothetical protein KAU14_05235, partial [Thermoplasmata archaeon]|nr:hypothetical protein [Thermoplasmata archaeon]
MKQSTKRYQFLIAFFIAVVAGILVLTLAANETSADTIIVAKDGNGEHDNIQDAIDAATEGDTIRVWEGTYYENVVVNKSVSLIGNGSEETTIDAGGSGSVVKITADWAKMSGFMVTGSGTSWPDAGISVESNHNIISKNNCSNNHYGIYLSSSSACT